MTGFALKSENVLKYFGLLIQIDAFLLANNQLMVKGQNGTSYSLSTAWKDVVAYEKLTDAVRCDGVD